MFKHPFKVKSNTNIKNSDRLVTIYFAFTDAIVHIKSFQKETPLIHRRERI